MIKGAVNNRINGPLNTRNSPVPRPFNPDLTKNWKVSLPAPLAARVELALFDRINKKPKYGERGQVIAELLELWLDGQIPSISIQPRTPE